MPKNKDEYINVCIPRTVHQQLRIISEVDRRRYSGEIAHLIERRYSELFPHPDSYRQYLDKHTNEKGR